MSTYNTVTSTTTYTVVDIKKTFEGFDADLKMIARRTGKWTNEYAGNVFHDILKWAESKYLNYVDITLIDIYDVPLRAARYKVNENGSAISSERPGGNDWIDMPNTSLTVIVSQNTAWHALSQVQQNNFKTNNDFKISWSGNNINNSYSHLRNDSAQLYGSKGYEIQKSNFK